MDLDAFFKSLPADVDAGEIKTQWQALKAPYDINRWTIPLPLWACRQYDDSGPCAWENLQKDPALAQVERPFCLYIHIPFCSSKCNFCDSYSFKLGNRKAASIEAYVAALCDEMRQWSQLGALRQRVVSTVHLGGGTPALIGEDALRTLVNCVRDCFTTTSQTEWALETTIQSLTPAMIAALDQMGFRRLHLGIQSLEDPVRVEIGRHTSASQALEVTSQMLQLGWVVSVDLLVGLPYQTLAGFLDGIDTLARLGVNGFSLYELLIYPQNAKWAARHNLLIRDHLENYLMFQAGASLLSSRGYHKNLFNHWSDPLDKNIYFSFPQRNEDCLAIGTIADGVFGSYRYRHPDYAAYLRAYELGIVGLEGGLRQTPYESLLQPLIIAILAGYIPPEIQPLLFISRDRDPGSLMDRWVANLLVTLDAQGGMILTTNGSWFAGNLISDLTGLHRKGSNAV